MSTSAVSSVNSSQSLYQYYQTLSQSGSVQAATTGSNSTSPADTSSTSTAAQSAAAQSAAGQPGRIGHHHHGGGGGGGGGLLAQIQQAVNSALSSSDSSDSSTDPNQVIQNAIASVLQNNAAGAATGTSTTATSTTGSSTQTGSSTSSGSSTSGAVGQGGSSQDSTQQAFALLLQQNGVNAQQFQQDLLSALQGANGGQFDAATAFQSFPPGSVINTLA